MRYLLLLIVAFTSHTLFSQEDSIQKPKVKDSTLFTGRSKQIKEKPEGQEISITDYKIISHSRDTTYLDTTLTIQKEYKYNYLRRDDFELMPFSNVGQPYNYLGVDFERPHMYPVLGALAKHFNYLEIEDIKYYNVATPMTDLFFKTTFEQGQLLDALITFNTSRRLNFSMAYKGFRSLGKYQLDQSESGNFRTTFNYITRNQRYAIRGHIAAQNIDTEENGGLLDKEAQFESENDDFTDRSRIDVVLTDVNNRILGKRYFVDHHYKLVRSTRDSSRVATTVLAIGHQFNYETKFYQFLQDTQNDFFGTNVLVTPIDDKASLKTMYNEFSTTFSNRTLGSLKGYASLYNYNYFFNSILITESLQQIDNQLKGEEIVIGAAYDNKIGQFFLKGRAAYTVSGDLTTSLFDGSASYTIKKKHKIGAALHSSSRMPNFNYLLYQSDYQNYNWQNTSTFENQRVNSLQFTVESPVWGNLIAKYTTLDNYTYFSSDATQEQIDARQEIAFITPKQETSSVNHLKLKYNKEFKVGNWALNNTVMYQNVSQSNTVLNVPELVSRNTLYYSNHVFKKAMYIQTGVTFKYFTEYNMNAYNPLLGEFYIQNNEELGGFPMLDFFINAKIRQTRIYLKAEHFNSSFSGNNFYSAPNYPYRDFVIRFGLVWNFFS